MKSTIPAHDLREGDVIIGNEKEAARVIDTFKDLSKNKHTEGVFVKIKYLTTGKTHEFNVGYDIPLRLVRRG